MNNKSNEDRLKVLVSGQLAVSGDDITPELSFNDDMGADSLDHISIMMGIEEEFDIEITDDEWETVETFGDALELVEQST